jgi:ABC-type nitrate/sulfonate/bicarbonate transport system substrate-binding protein
MLWTRWLAILIVGAVAAFGCSTQAGAAQMLNLRYGQAYSAAHSVFSLPISVAEREGFFRGEGLNVQVVIPIPGGSDKMIAALHQGWVDLTHVATPFLIRAAMAGSDSVAIDTEFENPLYSLVAKPDVKTFADLEGKRIGLADLQGTISISMRKLLAVHGLDRDSYQVKVEEGTPQRAYCLRHGDCDAVVLGQPQDLQAIADGYRLLGRSDAVEPQYLYTVTAARRSWAETHKDAVTRFVRALAASFAFIRDPANRRRVVGIIAETAGCSDAVAAQTLDLFVRPGSAVLPMRGEIDISALARVIAMMAEAGLLKPPLPSAQRFVDLQYLRAAGLQ